MRSVVQVDPLKIVHLVESMDRGGLERVVCDLAQQQLRTGHRVDIVCLFRSGLLAEEARRAGVRITVIGKRTGLDLCALFRLQRALKDSGADVIHTHNATAHYHAALVVGRRARPVLINTRHGMGASRASDRRERRYSRALGRTDAVAAVCRAVAERLLADGIVPASLVRVVPNGIQLHAFANDARAVARRHLAVAADALVLGTVGRLNPAKDHKFLLHAFRQVAADIPNALLVIIGEGEQREALERVTAELDLEGQVRFLGDRPDVACLLPGLDIFVLSSRTEGYSIALLEASAAGLAVVATDVGGNREIVRHDETGLLVPYGNLGSMVDAMRVLAISPALRARLGGAARAWCAANASLEVMAERYELLYLDHAAATAVTL